MAPRIISGDGFWRWYRALFVGLTLAFRRGQEKAPGAYYTAVARLVVAEAGPNGMPL